MQFRTLAPVVLFAAMVAAQPRVEVPSTITVCQPAAISWSGASGNVFLSAVIGTDTSVTSSAQRMSFPQQSGPSGSYPWTVNVQPGTTLTFIVNDSTGVQNFSSQIQVVGQNTCNAGADFSGAAATGSSSGSGSTSSTRSGSSGAASPTGSGSGTSGNGASRSNVGALALSAGAALVGGALVFA
ncbi:hypothetical protein IE81DRAFT_326788 [Ceraceosorus guamensis]|uniref:Ser-Thr-rich glycosyl-phosphatidyl-inositol-anchored membrane family-domain-containing protein n=1 Tax=Ceraceosorus guamensis TaxID=1522189 RepID=A0A316VPJ3_9BASI|nr:hypothetical protein IE81DRAFT_326788 [Ceraceosorus guamensis]PWN39204.1 hypothetical protein IE81DRAFT_326788 [Ceraceosorus guamensis]